MDFGTSLQFSHVSVLRGNVIVKHCLAYTDVNSKNIEAAMVRGMITSCNLLDQVKNFAGEFQRKNKLDLYENKRAVLRLSAECERVKGGSESICLICRLT